MNIGDRVKLRDDSMFYEDNNELVGTVEDLFGPSCKVLWDNGEYNYYLPEDLVIVKDKLLLIKH